VRLLLLLALATTAHAQELVEEVPATSRTTRRILDQPVDEVEFVS